MQEYHIEAGEYKCRVITGDKGNPPYLVLLHGYSFTSYTWKEIGLLDRLEEQGIPFLSVDMPYGSESQCRPKSRDAGTNILLLEEILQRVVGEASNVVILGASLGGYIALRYCIDHPLEGLLLVGPVGLGDRKARTRCIMNVPLLIIMGENDKIVTIGEARKFVEEGGKAKLKIYPGAGHPAYLYRPEEFAKDVVDFYREIVAKKTFKTPLS